MRKHNLIVDLSQWMQRCKLLEQLARFRTSRQRRCKLRRRDMWTSHQLLRYLRNLGCVCMARKKSDRTALGQLVEGFERHLRSERGLSGSTLVDYPLIARQFLNNRFSDKPVRVRALRPHDIHRFIVRKLKVGSRGQAKRVVSALRSFLRFLHQRNKIVTTLAAAVPGVADWRFSHLPRSLPPNQVKRLIASCDRTTSVGRRDYAILLLMARLGLRAGEVAKMTLDDLDWARGEIVVHGKGQREDRVPLPTDVGAALVSYLRCARPECSTRRMFVRTRPPLQSLKPSSIGAIVDHRLKRVGLNPETRGSHLLRHSLAMNLQRRGATLTEIGQLLRHNDLTTTKDERPKDEGDAS